MAEEINIHVATDLNTDKLPIKTVNNVAPDSNGNIEVTNATDPNAVHKTGNETINGVKSFGDIIKATNGTVQVGADTGYSVTFNYNGNITSKQARGTYNIFLPDANGTLAIDDDVVHTTGTETINGSKTFTSDINFKNNNIDLTTKPSSTIYSNYIFKDKNEKTLSYIQYAHNPNGIHNLGFFLTDSANKLYGVTVNSAKEFYPFGDNTYSLGKSNMRWANAYINRVVCARFTHSVNNGSVYITGGSEWDKGATLALHGEESSDAGAFVINSRDKTRSQYLVGRPDGTLQWTGKNVAFDENLVHRSGDETIAGNKTFSNKIKGNLQGNADTATRANSADSVAWANVTGKPAYVTATWVSGFNWYRKWSDGFIEMGGRISGLSLNQQTITVTFPIAFSNNQYTVNVTTIAGDDENTVNRIATVSKTLRTTSMTLVNNGWDNTYVGLTVSWYACGY